MSVVSESDGVIAALRKQVNELTRERETFGMVAQTEICRLQNQVAQLTLEKADLQRAFDALANPAKIAP